MIEWFEKEVDGPMVREELDGSCVMVFPPNAAPDWVRTPPILGGRKIRVLRAVRAACVCGDNHTVQHLVLANGMLIAECPIKGFMWYQGSKKGKPDDTNTERQS